MDIKNAKYNYRGTIDCEIEHPVYGWIPFTADPDDVEELGKEIYEKCLKLDIAPYIEPTVDFAAISRVRRDSILTDLDTIISNPLRWADFSKSEKQIISQYRKDLLNVPQQEGFPLTINWPDKPEFI